MPPILEGDTPMTAPAGQASAVGADLELPLPAESPLVGSGGPSTNSRSRSSAEAPEYLPGTPPGEMADCDYSCDYKDEDMESKNDHDFTMEMECDALGEAPSEEVASSKKKKPTKKKKKKQNKEPRDEDEESVPSMSQSSVVKEGTETKNKKKRGGQHKRGPRKNRGGDHDDVDGEELDEAAG